MRKSNLSVVFDQAISSLLPGLASEEEEVKCKRLFCNMIFDELAVTAAATIITTEGAAINEAAGRSARNLAAHSASGDQP